MLKKTIIALGIPIKLSNELKSHFNLELFEFVNFSSVQELGTKIKNYKVSLIFIYNIQPDLKDCQELTIALKSNPDLETVPVLVISEVEVKQEDRIRMLKSSLIDGYITTGVSTEEACAYANLFLQRYTLEEELELKNELLNKLSITDELTKLFNRRYLIHSLEEELKKIDRYDYPLSCMMLDIDHFKKVNDKFGHSQGDIALEKLAQLVKRNVRSIDIPCRYGGEEIVIVMPYANLDGIYDAAERLRKKVEDFDFGSENLSVKFTVSIGIICLESKDKANVDLVFSTMDKQLYQAKNTGRNRICGGLYKDLHK